MCAPNRSANDDYGRDLQRKTDFDVDDLSTFVEINLPILVLEQRIVYCTIFQVIRNQSGRLYCLNVSGDTVKTFLILLILATNMDRIIKLHGQLHHLELRQHLDSGQTALKLPLHLQTSKTLTCNITKKSRTNTQ